MRCEMLDDCLQKRERFIEDLERLEEIYMRTESPQSPRFDFMPKSNGKSDIANNIAVRDKYVRLAARSGAIYFEARLRCIEMLEASTLPENVQTILRYRYIDGKKWDFIAARLGMCRGNIMRIHSNALQILAG